MRIWDLIAKQTKEKQIECNIERVNKMVFNYFFTREVTGLRMDNMSFCICHKCSAWVDYNDPWKHVDYFHMKEYNEIMDAIKDNPKKFVEIANDERNY